MGVEASPAFLQAETYSAEVTRRAIYCLLDRGSTVGSVVGGLIGATDLQVTYAGSGLDLSVSTGECVVPGSSSTTQSGYYLRGSSTTAITPAAANPTNPRIDLIYGQVQDAAYTGSDNDGVIAIATGTPTGGASLSNLDGAPSLPTSSLALAYVLIPANATTISDSDILNVSALAKLGLIPTATAFGSNSGSDYNTTSGSYSVIDGINLTVTLAIAGTIEVGFDFSCAINGGGVGVIDFYMDGTTALDNRQWAMQCPTSLTAYHNTIVTRFAGIASGTHTIVPRFVLQSGTAFYIANGSISDGLTPATFWVRQV